MDARKRVYALILQRPLADFTGARYEFHVYTDDEPPFERLHVTSAIGAMLDFVRAYVQEELAYELADNPLFWEGVPPEVTQITDPALRAFAQYTLHGIVAPIHTLAAATYLRGVLEGKANARFIIGWEAQPPLHDVAYCILEVNV